MEYTRSIGDAYETFEGTPEEISKLIGFLKRAEQNEVPKRSGGRLSVNVNMESVAKNVVEEVKKKLAATLNVVHEPVLVEEEVVYPGRFMTYKTTGEVTCSCGDEGCELYQITSEGR